ncbi:hypothetical protein [Glycomyces albidus]|uniref:Uncharacterized protein n=1 Tax=Glycomyces albidus TaxID=2656774 RepID=A0A6L5GAZ5_9ACTN|nr:hypothetical protein [Glycomyces albidus]MQM26733.1 hypothetical protein [Glycomyces albidus]
MTLRFADGLPVLGYREVADRTLAFAWHWHEPTFRLTFTEHTPALLGHVTHLDCLPRLAPAPDNLDWLDDERIRAVLDHAIGLWTRKGEIFRECTG